MSRQSDNLGALYARHPRLAAKRLEHSPAPVSFKVVASRSGAPTATVAELYLHSRYDPRREARRLAGNPPRTGDRGAQPAVAPTAIVFYGFGLGYLVEAFVESHPGLPMVVVENSAGAFAAALAQRDLRELLDLPNLRWHIADPPEAVLMSLDGLPLGGARVVRLPAAVEADRDYYRRLDALLQSLLDKREVNTNTLQRFGRLWVRNLLFNLECFAAHPGITELAGAFSGAPALVLAAGPSLEELLPHLAALRERMLLVAVDTSHRFCLAQGFEPDLLVSVDPQYWNTRHLDWLSVRRSILVCESAVNPRLFHRYTGEPPCLYFVSSFFPLGQLLERTIGQRGAVGAGGSVSTTAWDVARLIGATPVYLAGLDLGFPGGRTHARGAFFEERLHTLSRRHFPAEQGVLAYLSEAGPVWMPSNAGDGVLTDRRMLIYKAWFEDQLKQEAAKGSRTSSFNLSGRGLRVEGLPGATIRECLSLPVIRRELEGKLQAARRRAAGSRLSDATRGALLRALEALGEDLHMVLILSRRGASVCARMLAGPPASRDRALLEELEAVDREILSLSSRQIAAFLLQPLIGRILDQSGRARDYGEILGVSRALYSEMAASTLYHGELVKLSIDRLKAPDGGSRRLEG